MSVAVLAITTFDFFFQAKILCGNICPDYSQHREVSHDVGVVPQSPHVGIDALERHTCCRPYQTLRRRPWGGAAA